MMKRDGAADAVLAAETLIEQYVRHRAKHLYPEIWAQLDIARAELASASVELPAYDKLRERFSAGQIEDAREAADVLRTAMPEVPWQKLRIENGRATAAHGERVVTNRMRHVAIGLLIVAALIAGIFGAYKLMGKPAEQPAVRETLAPSN